MTFQQPHELGLAIPLRSIASRLCGALALYKLGQQMKIIILIVMSFMFVGCSTHLTRTSYSIDAGMSKQVVIERMGLPDRRSMRGDDEALQYSEIVGFGQCSYIIVWLSEGKVTAVTSRSGPSVAGCGLGSKEVDWGQMPKPQLNVNITTESDQ